MIVWPSTGKKLELCSEISVAARYSCCCENCIKKIFAESAASIESAEDAESSFTNSNSVLPDVFAVSDVVAQS